MLGEPVSLVSVYTSATLQLRDLQRNTATGSESNMNQTKDNCIGPRSNTSFFQDKRFPPGLLSSRRETISTM